MASSGCVGNKQFPPSPRPFCQFRGSYRMYSFRCSICWQGFVLWPGKREVLGDVADCKNTRIILILYLMIERLCPPKPHEISSSGDTTQESLCHASSLSMSFIKLFISGTSATQKKPVECTRQSRLTDVPITLPKLGMFLAFRAIYY